MGALASRAESETCRIIVEDVTSPVTSPEVVSPRGESPAASDPPSEAGSRRQSTQSAGSRHSSIGTPATVTEFWVPDSVIQRSRARSLVSPELLANIPGGGGLSSSSSSYNQSKLSNDSGLCHVTAGGCRPRRSSMYDALDFSQINANLYQRPPLLGSELTAASHGSGQVPEENLGSLHLSLYYDTDTSLLNIEIIQAADLYVNLSQKPNAYVIVRLLPDVTNQLQTRVVTQTRNPYWAERFLFEVTWSDLTNRCLEMKVYHHHDDGTRQDDVRARDDHTSRAECLGKVQLSMDQFELSTKLELWKGISADDTKKNARGELLFSLSYLPSAERLTVVVVQATNLHDVTSDDSSCPLSSSAARRTSLTSGGSNATQLASALVKVSLIVASKKVKKKKTTTATTRPPGVNAVWNEALTFTSVTRQQLETTTSLELGLYDPSHDDAVAMVTVGLGNGVLDDESRHWRDMLNGKPSVAKWHRLQPVTSRSQQQQHESS